MKKLIPIVACALLALGAPEPVMAADKPAKKKAQSKLRHVVVFKYKESTTEEQIAKVNKEFRALKKKIPGILAFEMGTNNSPEGLNKGFTHVYLVTFKDEASRKAYLPHPEHEKFVGLIKPLIDDVFVVDYWTR